MAYVRQRTWIEYGPRLQATARRGGGRRRRGVGMYPDETCYDPTRPSWLPNYIDDFAEGACKINMLLCGNPTCNTAQPGQPGADPQTVANAGANCAYSGGSFDPSTGICTPASQSWLNYIPLILAGVLAVAVVPEFIRGGR